MEKNQNHNRNQKTENKEKQTTTYNGNKKETDPNDPVAHPNKHKNWKQEDQKRSDHNKKKDQNGSTKEEVKQKY